MNKKESFRGSSYYFLPEEESLAQLCNAPLINERIKLREDILNELVHRIGRAHSKITLAWNVLTEHSKKKREKFSALVSLEEGLLHDVISFNLLEISELIRWLYENNGFRRTALLLRRIGKRKLQELLSEDQIRQYIVAREFLFPTLKSDQENISDEAFEYFISSLKQNVNVLIAFRDKVIAHKFDAERFDTHLTYNQYQEIIGVVIRVLDAISIVATLKNNDWRFEQFKQDSQATSDWLQLGLMASLERLVA